ncbi:MAG TPA: acetamidase/formamidase family protein [archaeon]|nr:acetamidase/formamidase family protein [archaeon]
MDRKQFIGSLAAATAASCASSALAAPEAARAAGLGSNLGFTEFETQGIRRLSRDKYFLSFHAGLTPNYRVKLGEVVIVETLDCLTDNQKRDGTRRKIEKGDRVNPGTGPIFVEGIQPGDALAIDLLEIRVDDWGYSKGSIYELKNGYADFDDKLRLPLSPMIGMIGIAPAQGEMNTVAPQDTGGNMDCKEVRAGATLIFTARVEGALVGLGDVHALQGDGEIRGEGLETKAEVLLRFRKAPVKLSDRPVILRPEFVATVGSGKDLDEAARQATEDMVALVARLTGRDEDSANQLVNLVGDLRINQIVDPTKGARMELPTWAFGI